MAFHRDLTKLDPERTRASRTVGRKNAEIWEAASLATELVSDESVPVWTYERIEDTGTWWHVHRCDWPVSKFEVFSKLATARGWTYRQDEQHVAETTTPEDDRFVVDCSCGRSYTVAAPGVSLDYSIRNEATLLAEAHSQHERKCRA